MDDHDRTEAECLLDHGATYTKRVGLTPSATRATPIFAGLKPGAFSVYFGDSPIYHFDLEGRWQRAFVAGTHYLKGLDAAVQTIDRVREDGNLILKRQTLGQAEANSFDAQVRSMAMDLIASLDAGKLARLEPPPEKCRPFTSSELREFLDQIGHWDGTAWADHRQRYLATYGMLPFLPPECQNAIVLQSANCGGDSFGAGRHPEETRTLRSPAEFERHVQDVVALWGRRVLQSRAIFLAGSDVLRRPAKDAEAYLSAIRRHVPITPRSGPISITRDADLDRSAPRIDGIHVFLGEFTPWLPERDAWVKFAGLGLIRVSLGVESGDPEIRAWSDKHWSNEDLRATVSDLKAAGLGASVLTLVGAGGVERQEGHLRATAELITSLELDAGDFVFLLDENEVCDSRCVSKMATPLTLTAWRDQQSKLKQSLAPLKKRGVKVLSYTLEKQ